MPLDREIEVEHDTAEFVAELRRLADALEAGGAFTLRIGGEAVTIPEGARLSVEFEEEDGEGELEFTLSWEIEEADEDAEEDAEDEAAAPV